MPNFTERARAAEEAPSPSRFARGDRVRYVPSRANPPKTQSIAYTIMAVVPGSRFTSYRIKGDTEPYERVAGEPQLTLLD
ncbi:MAG: hypothetical protein JNJ73_17585 [Hyphomonadaceae bacterium]|nr:hypothetical protein [Hyphomonadaceae bacterium]